RCHLRMEARAIDERPASRLPQRSLFNAMGTDRTVPAAAPVAGEAAVSRSAGSSQRYQLPLVHRLLVADAAARFSLMGLGLCLVSPLGARWDADTDSQRTDPQKQRTERRSLMSGRI